MTVIDPEEESRVRVSNQTTPDTEQPVITLKSETMKVGPQQLALRFIGGMDNAVNSLFDGEVAIDLSTKLDQASDLLFSEQYNTSALVAYVNTNDWPSEKLNFQQVTQGLEALIDSLELIADKKKDVSDVREALLEAIDIVNHFAEHKDA